jgi:4-diphosphocytidyl-2-C-methyl-D-erythritol kinase
MNEKDATERTVLSPAKVNLFLRVLSRRPDGYHNIVSIVDLISLYDVLHILPLADERIVVKDDRGVLPEGDANTIYRAARLLKESYRITSGVSIYVEKRIPIGAGLGGPSSNAATTLRELARLWKLPVTKRRLMDMGRTIGADVPLFVYGRSCVMRGIGEKVSPVTLPSLWYLVVYPGIALKARDVYEGLKIVLTKGENDIKLSKPFRSLEDIGIILDNDLERVSISMCPTIGTIKEKLINAGSVGALMSGSGSSVFGIFENEEGARKAERLFNGMGDVFVAHSI